MSSRDHVLLSGTNYIVTNCVCCVLLIKNNCTCIMNKYKHTESCGSHKMCLQQEGLGQVFLITTCITSLDCPCVFTVQL